MKWYCKNCKTKKLTKEGCIIEDGDSFEVIKKDLYKWFETTIICPFSSSNEQANFSLKEE